MRIAISGTENQNKTKLVDAFLLNWSQYTTPALSYKDTIEHYISSVEKKGDLPDSKDVQWAILNDMVVTQQSYKVDDKVIFNRCPIDNIIYSLYLNDKDVENSGVNDEFIEKCIPVVRESMKDLDIIFTVPLTKVADSKHTDMEQELNSLFLVMFQESINEYSPFFIHDDRPTIIEVFGTLQERLEMIKMYLDEDGEILGKVTGILEPNSLDLEMFE